MKITNVKINGIADPIGYHYDRLCCSWNVDEAKGTKQTYARVEVSEDPAFQQILYVKEGMNLKQGGEQLEVEQKPRTTYYFRIAVRSDAGEESVSEVHTFETGKRDEAWEARWIAPAEEDLFHPVLQKSFTVKEGLQRARLYMTGVGMFEVYLDGEKLGEEYLAPYCNHYETNIQVLTFPAEEELRMSEKTEHTLSILLGKGWYMGNFGLEMQSENYGNRMAAIGELYLDYEDGSREKILTDETWTYRGSDIEDSGIYFGEIWNRQLWKDQENPERPVEVLQHPEDDPGTKNLELSHLMDRLSLPVKVKETIPVKEIIHTPAGETVLDMGQNFAGFMEFESDFPAGTKIVLDFGEILQDNNFYRDNYREAVSQFVYVSDGRKERVSPHFTFFGFRYVRVTGWDREVKKEDFTGCVLYSDLHRTGYIETGNAKINRLYANTLWGLKSNFIDIPTDCPQRNERLGWTGDAQVFSPTASYHMDTRAFFHKFVKDLRDEQRMLDGAVPNYLPNIGHKTDAGSVWGDIATFLPMVLYRYFGEKEELAYCYPLMKDWVDYIDRHDGEGREKTYLFDFAFSFGDWLALDGKTPTSFKGGTDDGYISSVYYYRSAQLVRQAAEYLGRAEEAAYYSDLEAKIRHAVMEEYFTPTGRLAVDTQAAYVIALKFGLYVDKTKLVEQFKNRLKNDMYQIKCGFVGAPLLCTALAEAGEYKLAWDFLLKEGFPSWLYCVNLGATTVWERWNSVLPDGKISGTGMNSLNHYAYGSVMEFVYAYGAGIRPAEPGFARAILAPHPDIRLGSLAGRYESANGLWKCGWKIEKDGRLSVQIEVPFNCEALVELPEYPGEKQMTLAAGSYEFAYEPLHDFRKIYGEETTLLQLADNREAMGVLKKHVPFLAGIAASGDPEMGASTLEDLKNMGYLPFDPEKLNQAIEEIRELRIEKKKAFIFDLDGVIVFTDQFHYQAWKKMADRMGIYFDEMINNRLRGVSRAESLEIILEKCDRSLTDDEKAELMTEKNQIYRELLDTMTPDDVSAQVRDTLRKLREAGCRLAIGSSSKNARFILEKVGLTDAFDAVSDGNNINRSKPDPEVFVKAAQYLGEEPENCVVVEDAYAGIDAAKAAGMTAVGIGDASAYEKADYHITAFEELRKIAGCNDR